MRCPAAVQGTIAAALLGLLAAAVPVLPAGSAGAAEGGISPWVRLDGAAVRLLAAGPATDGDAGRDAAVELRLDPGTLTYWRQPGDAGLPPRFDTAASNNLATVAVAYPAPALIDEDGAQLFGYRDRVVFPLRLALADPGRPAVLAVKLEAALCRQLCLPISAAMTVPLPGVADPAVAAALAAAQARVPTRRVAGAPGPLAVLGAASRPEAAVALDVRAPGPATLFLEGPEGWAFAAVPVVPDAGGRALVTLPAANRPEGAAVAGLALTATLVDGSDAVEVPLRVDGAPPVP